MRSPLALAMSLGILAGGSAPALAGQPASEHYTRGVSHERSVRIFEAVDEFRQAIALEPGNTGLLERQAWLLHAHQFREEAVEALERLLQRDTDKRAVHLGLGWNEMDLGRAARAIAHFNEAYGLAAPQDDVGKALAEIRARSVEENKAKISKLRQVPARDPADIAAEKELFQLSVYQAEWDNAFANGERLLAAAREDLPFRFAYYRGLSWAGRLAEAEAVLSGLMADSPDNAYLQYERGRVLRALGRPKEAEAALLGSLALYPGAFKTRRELCELLARSGRAEEAVAMASEMIREDGASLDAQLALARAFHYGGKWAEAIAAYRKVLSAFPYNVEALSGLAECSVRVGDLPGAEAAVTAWEAARRDDPGLGWVREQIKNATASLLVQADSFENSSHYRRANAGFVAKLQSWRGLDPRFGYYYSRFRQEGFADVERHTFLLEGEVPVSPALSVAARLGMNLYDNDQDHLNGKVALRASPFKGSFASLSYSRYDIIDTEPAFGNPLYNYVASIGAVGEKITTDDFALYLQQMVGDDLMLWGNVAYGSYSDGNEKRTCVLGADYRLTEAPRLHAHYSFFFLDYREPAPTYREGDARVAAYFDPNNFRVHTPGVELGFDLAPALHVLLVDDVSFVDNGSVTNSVACGLTLDVTKQDALRLDVRHVTDIRRGEDDEEYGATHLLASFLHRF